MRTSFSMSELYYVLCIFSVCMRGFLRIFHTRTYIYTCLWPLGNTSCIFLTWYQSIGSSRTPQLRALICCRRRCCSLAGRRPFLSLLPRSTEASCWSSSRLLPRARIDPRSDVTGLFPVAAPCVWPACSRPPLAISLSGLLLTNAGRLPLCLRRAAPGRL
jgi:hypothetical protein